MHPSMLHLDRLVANTNAIRAAASSSLPPSPFTRAILKTELGDLIREIEPAELGLFTPQLARVEFHGPAPRKKQDPEVYAQAAYTYIDRYNSIRPMPRAYAQVVGILDQIAATRENIRALTVALEQIQPSELKPLADQGGAARRHRDAAAVQPKPRKRLLRQKPAVAPDPPSTPVQSSKLDETFHTPAAAARTMRFTDNLLMDEQVDLADVSITSPVAPSRMRERVSLAEQSEDESGGEETVEQSVAESMDEPPDDDPTIVLSKTAVSPPPAPSPASPPTPPVQPATETPKKGKVRVNTEVERIVAKIWSSAGDLIMPGHSFDTSGTGGGMHIFRPSPR
ncbi:hypothetical protein MVEN_00545600 [Mycena venus]|uniref:Uncharacterized protein n=1 Tax=Mycena venus TaxID=2733690 RepID=A0A8H7D4K5_9AGAR|nr:hypothetical protein MVEN_00545600 [Mycena venus]